MAMKKRAVRHTEAARRMLRRSATERLKRDARVAFEFALGLVQDEKARRRLGSALEHIGKARQRDRRSRGFAGAARRLAVDQPLQAELRAAGRDLQQAYALVNAQRRRSRLPRITPLAALLFLAAAPRMRKRLSGLMAAGSRSRRRQSRAPAADSSSDEAASKPLDDLTKEELYARAQEAEVPGRSDMSKAELISALRANG